MKFNKRLALNIAISLMAITGLQSCSNSSDSLENIPTKPEQPQHYQIPGDVPTTNQIPPDMPPITDFNQKR